MEVTRIFDLLPYGQENFNLLDTLAAKEGGTWRKYSMSEVISNSDLVSSALYQTGIRKGDRVAIMSSNCPQWNFVDMGIAQLGAVSVPLYPTLSEGDLTYIIAEAEIKLIFVENAELKAKVKKVLAKLALDAHLVVFNIAESWNSFMGDPRAEQAPVKDLKAHVSPADLLTLIYTSGTTGDPKGVMLSHENVVSDMKACVTLMPKGTRRALSFLPLSHVFERTVNYIYFYYGVSVYYAENMEVIVDNLKEVQPHIFTTVPRLLEKVYDRIVAKGKEQHGIKRMIFFWALQHGLKYEPDGKNGALYELQLALARKLVFSKWKAALGGNILAIVSGGAALQPRLARVFTATGMTIMEGYGLTETSPVVAVNTTVKGNLRFETVGRVIEGDLVKIASDGEILVKGPNIMMGYYKSPEKTSKVIDSDGYFYTGDIGELDSDGFLKITDRKKEVFKTSGGKYVAPGELENKLKESPFVEQLLVIGEGRRFPSALIVPAYDHLRSWAAYKGISASNQQLIDNPLVTGKFQQVIDHYNEELGHWAQIKKFVLLPGEWTIDGGEMTPKLSVKRKVVMEKFKKEIEAMYA